MDLIKGGGGVHHFRKWFHKKSFFRIDGFPYGNFRTDGRMWYLIAHGRGNVQLWMTLLHGSNKYIDLAERDKPCLKDAVILAIRVYSSVQSIMMWFYGNFSLHIFWKSTVVVRFRRWWYFERFEDEFDLFWWGENLWRGELVWVWPRLLCFLWIYHNHQYHHHHLKHYHNL